MIYVVLFFLFTALFFYLIFGGADFGVGVLELFSSRKNAERNKATIYRVIGPVWEANHVWLILVLVILWVGFPIFYSQLMIQLHWPLTLLLVGIVFRGAAFVFRHYDAEKDGAQRVYDLIFQGASLWCTFFLGIIAGALVSGRILDDINPETVSFYAVYLAPWLNPFSLGMGVFVTGLSSYLSATFLIGESEGRQADYFRKKMFFSNVVTLLGGALIFLFAYLEDAPFLNNMLKHPLALFSIGMASILLIFVWRGIAKKEKWTIRVYVVLQVLLILLAYVYPNFPELVQTNTGGISLLETQSAPASIQNLGWMLIIGGMLILPGVFYLFKTFGMIKFGDPERNE